MTAQGHRRSDRPLPRNKLQNQWMVGMTQCRTHTGLLTPLSRRSSLGRLPGRRPVQRLVGNDRQYMESGMLIHSMAQSAPGLRLDIRKNRWSPRMGCMFLRGMVSERWRRCSPRSGRQESPDRWSDSRMAGMCRESMVFEKKIPRSPHSTQEMPHRTCPGPVAADTFLPNRESGWSMRWRVRSSLETHSGMLTGRCLAGRCQGRMESGSWRRWKGRSTLRRR